VYQDYVYFLIPGLPLLALLCIVAFARRAGEERIAPAFIIAALLGSLGLSVKALVAATAAPRPIEATIGWVAIDIGRPDSLYLNLGVLIDHLSAIMMVTVCIVSLLVQIYSIGYMKGERGYGRYFAYMSLFSGSMLGLVISGNVIQTYIFWELVGLCSYLLIGFWYRKPSAAAAAKKAFVVTRFGDLGFFAAVLYLSTHQPTSFSFVTLQHLVEMHRFTVPAATAIALLLFCGAMGKSAQFPLHIWLPDAMEGPTPVSALIHAATMVAAGVYLVARAYFFFAYAPAALLVVAVIGTLTLFFAATMGVAENDIKRVMAYSTISQLGYMMLALGVGGFAAGVFHLTTHAFFKALLFLTAGSVIHSIGTNDMWQMGGLRRKMPITALTCLAGALALSGIPPFAGFFSKDEILAATWFSALPGHRLFFAIAVFSAFLTAFYVFRLWFLTFGGAPRSHEAEHAHESPGVMTGPLALLGLLAVIAGAALVWQVPFTGKGFAALFAVHGEHEGASLAVMLMSILAAAAGVVLAWATYSAQLVSSAAFNRRFPAVYTLLKNAWYFNRAWEIFATQVVLAGSLLAAWFDRHIVNGMVDGVAWLCGRAGARLRLLQTGQMQFYAAVFVIGVLASLLVLFGRAVELPTMIGRLP
jgi:NADH-quinone oxidoreductase subunit L